MIKAKSLGEFSFFDYEVKAEFIINNYDVDKYIRILANKINVNKNLKNICSKSITSCLSRYIALVDMLNKGISVEKLNIKGEYKQEFCKRLLDTITIGCIRELEKILKEVYDINITQYKFLIDKDTCEVEKKNGEKISISLVEGRLFSNYFGVILGEEEKIEKYIDYVGDIIELERWRD